MEKDTNSQIKREAGQKLFKKRKREKREGKIGPFLFDTLVGKKWLRKIILYNGRGRREVELRKAGTLPRFTVLATELGAFFAPAAVLARE